MICFSERSALNDFEDFLEFPIAVQAAAICFVVCGTVLLVILLTAPRRNCFFFRMYPETRLLFLIFSPTLIILWPVILYAWLLKSRGIGPDDLDFFEDD
jgi:hypothetical protein